jgi:hypothetical protein
LIIFASVFIYLMRHSTTLTIVLLLAAIGVQGQSFYSIRKERSVIASFGLGTANYFGELTNPGSVGETKYGLSLGLEKYFNNRISGRVDINWYRISGDDSKANSDRVVRGLSFVSNNVELLSLVSIDLLPNGMRFYQRPGFNVYGVVGFGITLINPKTEYNGEMIALRPLKTEGVAYSRVQPVIPMGLGVKFKVGPFFNIAVEGGVRKTFTDYMDDISAHSYPDPATLSSDLARALSNRSGGAAQVRGNPEADDWYSMATVKLQYFLPSNILGQSNKKLYTKKRKSFGKPRRR